MKKFKIFALILVTFLLTGSFSYAKTIDKPLIPIWLNAPAVNVDHQASENNISGSTSVNSCIDFSITDNVVFTARTGSPEITSKGIKVTNHATIGQLCIDNLYVKEEFGWKLKPNNKKYFERLKSNKKEISIVADNIHDFANERTYNLGKTKLVPPKNQSNIVKFSGQTGIFTKKINSVVASVIPTISLY